MTHTVPLFVRTAVQSAPDWFTDAPTPRALYYSGFGVPLFVSGMMVSAFALRSLDRIGS